MSRGIFSGEPLPLQPALDDLKGLENPEDLGRFHFKLIEWCRRLGAKLDEAFNREPPSAVQTLVTFLDSDSIIPPRDGGVPGFNFETIPFNPGSTLWVDRPYTMNSDGAVTVGEKGLYFISAEIEFYTPNLLFPGTNVGVPLVEMRVMIERSGEGRLVDFSHVGIEHTADSETMNMTVCVPIPADHNIRVQVAREATFELWYNAKGTRMQILQLAKTDDGGPRCSGPNCGWGDPTEWPPWMTNGNLPIK